MVAGKVELMTKTSDTALAGRKKIQHIFFKKIVLILISYVSFSKFFKKIDSRLESNFSSA